MGNFFELMNRCVDFVINVINSVKDNLILTDENKIKYRSKAVAWAKFNLCLPFNASLVEIVNTKLDEDNINKLIDKYTNDKEVKKIKDKLLSISFINNSDVKEMLFLFNNKKYKSCIMMLFSFVDAIILNLQDDINHKKLPGKIEHINMINKEIEITFAYFEYCVLCEILKTIYASAENFKKDNANKLNRNYILHGVSTRVIDKYDCLKLMFLVVGVYDYFSQNIDNINNRNKKKIPW